jgi:uncharacterized protein involved in exopolysaccharide biosynthesis
MDEMKSDKHGSNGVDAASFLRDLLDVVFRRKRLMLFSFCGFLSGAVLAIVFMPSTYEAQMKILVERGRVDPVISTEGNTPLSDRDLTADEVASEGELFQSRDSFETVVLHNRLYEPAPHSLAELKVRFLAFIGLAPDKDTRVYRAVLNVEKNLSVFPVNNSNLLKITYQARSPEQAAAVLKELGDLYLAKHAMAHRLPGSSQFFEEQEQQYRKALADTEARLVNFTETTGVVSADVEKQATLQKLSDFDFSLEQTRASVAETQKRFQALQAQEGAIPTRLTTQVKSGDNAQLMANLKSTLLNLENRRTELLERYDSSYPLVVEVGTQITQTVAAIADAERTGTHEETTDQNPTHEWIRTEMAKAKADLVGLQARATVMAVAVQALRARAEHLDKAALVQQELLRTAKADEENYLLYQRKHEEARIVDALDQSRIVNAAVVEAVSVPLAPLSLPTGVKLVLAVLVAAAGSLGLGLLRENTDPSFRTLRDVEGCLDLPLLAAIPKNGNSRKQSTATVKWKPEFFGHGNGANQMSASPDRQGTDV